MNSIVNFFKKNKIGIHANKKTWKNYLKIKPLMLKSSVKEEGFQIYRWLIFVIQIECR